MIQLDSTTILLIVIALALGYLIYQGQQEKETTSNVTVIRRGRRGRGLYGLGRRGYRWGYPYYGHGYRRYY